MLRYIVGVVVVVGSLVLGYKWLSHQGAAEKRHVLLVNTSKGGPMTSLKNRYESLVSANYKCSIVGWSDRVISVDGVEPTRIRQGQMIPKDHSFGSRVDVVECSDGEGVEMILDWLRAQEPRPKVVYTFRSEQLVTTDPLVNQAKKDNNMKLRQIVQQTATHYIAITRFIAYAYKNDNFFLNGQDPVIIPNSLSAEFAKNIPARDPSQATRSIAIVGRVTTAKGADLVIEALKRIPKEVIFTAFFVGGDKDGWESSNIDDRIKFVGELDPPYLREKLVDCTIYISASLSEAFGNSLLEAMSQGCICVVSDIPASLELLELDADNQNFVFRLPKLHSPEDRERSICELSQRIENCLQKIDTEKGIVDNHLIAEQERVQKLALQYSPLLINAEVAKFYQHVLGNSAPQ